VDVEIRAPKECRGSFFEDFDLGDVFRSRLGRTITDADKVWFTCLTMNTDPCTAMMSSPAGLASKGLS
jgi:acyl dehydratase